MPRPRTHTKSSILSAAMSHFWQSGYEASSVDDLVKATGISRHSLYSEVGGKFDLYSACFSTYQNDIVTPALEAVEAPQAGLSAIEKYFETQINLAEEMGLPGPGCLVANAMTETAPHHQVIAERVSDHNARLAGAFANAISNTAPDLTDETIAELSTFLVTTAQGLWSLSRIVNTAAPLRRHVNTLMTLLKMRVGTYD